MNSRCLQRDFGSNQDKDHEYPMCASSWSNGDDQRFAACGGKEQARSYGVLSTLDANGS
jgi:hypothetical protein